MSAGVIDPDSTQSTQSSCCRDLTHRIGARDADKQSNTPHWKSFRYKILGEECSLWN